MYEQSAGLERLEYLSNLAQRPLFLMNPLRIEKFGTLREPVPVESISGHRIVGCSGFPVDSHELMWFECDVEKGPGRCPECGQAFAIQLVNQHLH
jgi:cytochrome c oxidase subunit 5b